MATISPERLQAILAAARAKKIAQLVLASDPLGSRDEQAEIDIKVSDSSAFSSNGDKSEGVIVIDSHITIDKYGNSITLNDEQFSAVDLSRNGQSLVLIGAAGTGKTTTTRAMIDGLIQSGRAGILRDIKHKKLIDGTPGIICVSYTRRAVANLRKAMSTDLASNCLTIHALLEYEPVYNTVFDPETGSESTKMSFQPTRNKFNPLPSCIHTIIIDESSMVSLELYHEILDACPHKVQFIFLGDIQQLPPVFGSAILGFKLLELPTIELTQVYRQALESPIIRLAHRILSGRAINVEEFPEWKTPNQLTLHPWKKKLDADLALMTTARFFTAAIDAGRYDPLEDMILMPFNKACGTIELNKYIAQHQASKRGALVYEIIAGFNKYYYSIGDKVLVDKEDGVIVGIKPNPEYLGAKPAVASLTLDYWGAEQGTAHHVSDDIMSDEDIDKILELAASSDSEDRVRQCSHTITVRMLDTDREVQIKTASDVNAMLLAYCLTVHKSQGSEWRKVFLVLHQSHATMLQRELLYTACTRAREELYVICELNSFVKGIESQRIKGATLAEKAEFFKGKIDNGALDKYRKNSEESE